MANRPPNLRKDRRSGNWIYRKRVPERLHPTFGGKTEITRSLGVSTDQFSSRELRSSYQRVKAAVDAEIASAEAPSTALNQRDQFGLMREMLLEYEMQGASGLVSSLSKTPASNSDATGLSEVKSGGS